MCLSLHASICSSKPPFVQVETAAKYHVPCATTNTCQQQWWLLQPDSTEGDVRNALDWVWYREPACPLDPSSCEQPTRGGTEYQQRAVGYGWLPQLLSQREQEQGKQSCQGENNLSEEKMTNRHIVLCSQEGYSKSGGEIIPLNIPFNQASLLAVT